MAEYQGGEIRQEPPLVSSGWIEIETNCRFPHCIKEAHYVVLNLSRLQGEWHSLQSHRDPEPSLAGRPSGRKPHSTLLRLEAVLIALLTERLSRE